MSFCRELFPERFTGSRQSLPCADCNLVGPDSDTALAAGARQVESTASVFSLTPVKDQICCLQFWTSALTRLPSTIRIQR